MARFPPELPPGIFSDDSSHTAAGRWRDGSNMRFRLGKAETIGGWESVISDLLTGVCRAVFCWTDSQALLNLAFGTHSHLQLYQSGQLYDLTPTLGHPARVLTDPFTVTDGSTTVTIDWPGHGLQTDDEVVISDAAAVGRITPDGTYAVTVVDEDSFTITHGSAADLAETLGSNPLATTSGSPLVVVTDTAHGLPDGLSVTISGASTVNGLTPNGTFQIAVVDANSYRINAGSNASGTGSGGGSSVVVTVPATGGGEVTIAPQNAFTVGQIDGTGSNGYGTGAYGVGGYGEPSESENFPRTWSMSALGQSLIATPRGGTIYAWDNDTGEVAKPITNAPRKVNCSIVTPQGAIMAIGCNEEVSGVFNPFCIRHSSVAALDPLINREVWHTDANTSAREYILQGAGEPVSARNMGDYVLVWTTDGLFVGEFVGDITSQVYRFSRAPGGGGLIGPNAAVVRGARAVWLGPDLQFYQYTLGGEVSPLECPIRSDLADNIAAAQGAKVHASLLSSRDEVWFYYPDERDGEGLECSRYVALNISSGVDGGSWFRGIMGRTAAIDAGPAASPCRVTAEGNVYWHERGNSADGGDLDYFVRSGSLLADENYAMMAVQMWPDFEDQKGPVFLTVYQADRPRQAMTPRGPYPIAANDVKIDIRATGRYFELEYRGTSYVRVQNSVFDLRRAGAR